MSEDGTSDGRGTSWTMRRAARRVRPGDGRPLQPFRWWQHLSRSLLYLTLARPDGGQVTYAVEVRHLQGDDGEGRAHLYVDGRQQATSKLPAAFPVEGGTIEVVKTAFGLRRCHYVADDGSEYQLVPDPASAEGRRARLDRENPGIGRLVSAVSVLVLVVSVVLLVPQLAEVLFRLPPVAERFGTFTSPVVLPAWLNIGLTLAAAAASTERALRLRYHWLLDGVGN
ncbi:hypothetical protein ACIG47_04060 [Promicromonospora sp. NPDC052451]|uniref:hypothetical protein n=1 Tax=unclassified Promicromonospora TaxID=2647929 RepID=UPI0037C72540